MFYTGLDPYTLQPVYVPRIMKEKAHQRALLQYFKPENRDLVLAALKSAKRFDLIGTGPDCLVAPDPKDRKTPNRQSRFGKQVKPSKNKKRRTR